MLSRYKTGIAKRFYLFLKKDDDDECDRIAFSELPSRATGNTVLRAFAGEADALNNLAVLLYAEVANPGDYSESQVLNLLERAAKTGNATARRNLEVFHWNRGAAEGAEGASANRANTPLRETPDL